MRQQDRRQRTRRESRLDPVKMLGMTDPRIDEDRRPTREQIGVVARRAGPLRRIAGRDDDHIKNSISVAHTGNHSLQTAQ